MCLICQLSNVNWHEVSNLIPALSDNGASLKAGCSRTLHGALLDSLKIEDAGSMKVGDANAQLVSKGSYIYLHERYGASGAELAARRPSC